MVDKFHHPAPYLHIYVKVPYIVSPTSFDSFLSVKLYQSHLPATWEQCGLQDWAVSSSAVSYFVSLCIGLCCSRVSQEYASHRCTARSAAAVLSALLADLGAGGRNHLNTVT